MIKIIELAFRILVFFSLGTIIIIGLIFCALLFWESRYLDLADECKDLIFFDKKQE